MAKWKQTPLPHPHLRLPQELPEQWTNTKKLAIQVKQNVAPLQANEVNILRRKCQQFEVAGAGSMGVGAAHWDTQSQPWRDLPPRPHLSSLTAQAARIQREVPT